MSWFNLAFMGGVFTSAAVFGLLIPALIVGSHRSAAFGAGVVGAMHLVDTWFIGTLALPLGLTVTPFDFAFIVLAVATVARLRHLPVHDRLVRLWLITCVIWLMMFALGAVIHKTKAGVEYRVFFYLSVGVTYLLSFRMTPETMRRVLGVFALFAAGTLLVAGFRWGCELFDPGLHPWQESPGRLNWRVINAQQTYILVAVWLTALSAVTSRDRNVHGAWWLLAPVMFCAVALLQHRTNWVVLFASTMLMVAVQRGKAGSKATMTAALLAGMVAVAALGSLSGGVGDSLQNAVAEPFQQKSTMNWRLDSWREVALSWAHGGPSVWPFGYPFGQGWRRFIESSGQGGLHWEVSPHSFYVTTLARGGIAALVLMVSVLVLAIRRHLQARKSSPSTWPGPSLMMALIASQAVFFVTYSIIPMATLFLGLALSAAVVHERPSRITSKRAGHLHTEVVSA